MYGTGRLFCFNTPPKPISEASVSRVNLSFLIGINKCNSLLQFSFISLKYSSSRFVHLNFFDSIISYKGLTNSNSLGMNDLSYFSIPMKRLISLMLDGVRYLDIDSALFSVGDTLFLYSVSQKIHFLLVNNTFFLRLLLNRVR